MALNASFVWKNADSTADLNDRTRQLIQRGIYFGGGVTPGVGLTVVVNPFIAMSFDGMTISNDSSQILTVTDGQVNVLVVRAKYNALGSPATVTLQYEVLEESIYLADAEKDYLINFGKVDIPAFAVSVNAADIDFTESDEVDQVGRSLFRGTVANSAALPTPTSPTNRVGDFYFVNADSTFYFWDGSAWNALNTGSFNSEVSHMNDTLVQAEQRRQFEGSGVISGPRLPSGIGVGDYASFREVDITDTASVADQIGIGSFTAYVNGFYVQTYAQNVSLPAKPGVGTRFDLIFLEVWREQVISPQTHAYGRNPDGASTYDIDEVETQGTEVLWVTGPAGNNFDLPEIEAHDHDWVVTKWRLGVAENVPIDCLHQPGDNTVASVATNIDAVAFSAPAGTGVDNRIWMATSAVTPIDGKSWAIPLIAIRRRDTENAGIADAVKQFRDNIRHAFHVYPIVDISRGARETLTTIHRKETGGHFFASGKHPYDKPSGFLNNVREFPIQAGVGANTIKFFDDPLNLRIRGMEDWIPDTIGTEFDLGTPPGGTGYTRVLVYLKMNITLYWDNIGYISSIHRPYFPSQVATPMDNMGWKQGFVSYEVVVSDLGTVATLLDVDDAMTAEGWSRGDASQPAAIFSGKEFEDGGIWSKSISITADDRVHPHAAEWAIPICLVHRRNTTAWDFDTNPNGTTASRPDDRTDATVIHADDIVDLRMLADTDVDIDALMEESIDKLMKGQLRTRLANKWAGNGSGGNVAGSRILQSDHVVPATASAAAFRMPDSDNVRRIWSDAKEFHVVARQFPLDANFGDPENMVDFTNGGGTGPHTLIIRAPAYAHIVRHLPAVFMVDGTFVSADYLDFRGPPCWTTQEGSMAVSTPVPVSARFVDTTFGVSDEAAISNSYENFEVTATDSRGRATEMTLSFDSAGAFSADDVACLSWWIHYDRSLTTPYNANYGLAEVPDRVWSATKAHFTGTPEELHIGTIHTIVRKTLAAASSFTVTDTDVQTASGVSGTTFTLLGVDVSFSASSSLRRLRGDAPLPEVDTLAMNPAQDTITVNLLAPYTGDIDIVVYFETDEVNQWIEVGQGGKSVRAFFEWHKESIDNTVDPEAVLLGNDIWQHAELGDRILGRMPIMWTRPDLVSDWDGAIISALYPYSNMLLRTTGMGVNRYKLIVMPKHVAPSNSINDEFIVHYTYTPYQGLSGEGGAAAVPGTAVPRLKNMLHGRVEANSDFFATQSGPASYFGGVDSWKGHPARLDFLGNGHYNGIRFWEYNSTSLVLPGSVGTQQLLVTKNAASSFNAAAVLRLPFPSNAAMLDVATSTYHKGPMEFDLDPAREGAGAGYLSFAPGYPGGLASAAKAVRSQYVNSLTPLATRSAEKRRTETHLLAGFDLLAKVVISGSFEDKTYGYDIAANSNVLFRGNYNITRNHLLNRSLTSVEFDQIPPAGAVGVEIVNLQGNVSGAPATELFDGGAGSVIELSIPSALGTIGVGNLVELYLVSCPGSVLATIQNADLDEKYPVLKVQQNTAVGSAINAVRHTIATIDSERSGYFTNEGPISFNDSDAIADVIRIPFGSSYSSASSPQLGGVHLIGRSSLRGSVIAYPSSWTGSDITVLEGLIVASTDSRRGLYLGSTTQRHNMPVFVPGSGSQLDTVLKDEDELISSSADAPEPFPYMPGEPVFVLSNRFYDPFDHGGPIAYVFFGMIINPSDDDFHGRAVMQISGGATGTDEAEFGSDTNYRPTNLSGTAIDAFWPLYRPVIKSRK